MTDMMQLKADYTESSSEVQKLKSKIKDLTSSLETKEDEILKLREFRFLKMRQRKRLLMKNHHVS